MWKSTGSYSQGSGHKKSDIPCQDRVAHLNKSDCQVAALADGAGSARYSQFGAEGVVNHICEFMCDHFDEIYANENTAEVRQILMKTVLTKINEISSEMGCEPGDLASTLLVTGVKNEKYILIHLGDGVIGYIKNNELRVATHPDNGEFLNETYFTTSKNSERMMRLAKGSASEIQAFILMSDGTENSLYDKRNRTLAPVVSRIVSSCAYCTDEAAQKNIDEIVRELFTRKTADDCSLMIMVDPIKYQRTAMETEDLIRLLGLKPGRDTGKQAERYSALLDFLDTPKNVHQLQRFLHVKEKHVKKRMNRLIQKGFVTVDSGMYRRSK